jgi:hypothetical protein
MRRPSSSTWPEAMRPGGSSRPMMDAPVSDFAGRDLEGDVVEGAQRAAARGKFDDEVLDLEQAHRSLGLRASRSQSPSRFTDSAIRISMTPGNTAIHHSPDIRKSLPLRISVPSEGWVGGTPTPR